jgi:hypothetical protein
MRFDNLYGGLHGMEDFDIVECHSIEEAEEIAKDMSCNVINSYSCITDHFSLEDFLSSEESESLLEEDVAYEIYELVDDAPFDFNYQENFSDFVKNWGKNHLIPIDAG